MATIDDIINGSFDAIGAPPPYLTPAYRPEDYASIYATPRGNGMWGSNRPAITARPTYSPYMTAAEKAQLEKQVAESKSLQATIGQTPTAVASGWNTPTRMDLAAIEAAKSNLPGPSLESLLAYAKGLPDKTAVNPAVLATTNPATPNANVTAAIKPQSRGGLFDLLFGPSKNGMGGLAGLLGGPGAGGPLGMLIDNKTATPAKTGPSGVGTNGYTYVNGQNMGYAPAELAKREAQGKAIAAANKKNPNPTRNVSGDRNDFSPKSVQSSVRWQTGY